jgi:integrase-like protein
VFASLEGTALEERSVRHVFTRILEKANLRQIRIHDLRHTYATLLLQAGAPITYVSQQMGHRDASITLRNLPDASRREVDRLTRAWQGRPSARGVRAPHRKALEGSPEGFPCFNDISCLQRQLLQHLPMVAESRPQRHGKLAKTLSLAAAEGIRRAPRFTDVGSRTG